MPAVGTAGGILVGVNTNKFEVIAWQLGVYYVAAMIRNNVDKFTWRLVVVYGSPYEEGKMEFIQKLENLLVNLDGPTIFGGDFNIVSNAKEKNNGNINQKWADLFKDWVNNNQEDPVMAALDKILCTTSWEHKFPLAFVTVRARASSDHVPLILDMGIKEEKNLRSLDLRSGG